MRRSAQWQAATGIHMQTASTSDTHPDLNRSSTPGFGGRTRSLGTLIMCCMLERWSSRLKLARPPSCIAPPGPAALSWPALAGPRGGLPGLPAATGSAAGLLCGESACATPCLSTARPLEARTNASCDQLRRSSMRFCLDKQRDAPAAAVNNKEEAVWCRAVRRHL